MIVVGLTGGLASGKSTVARMFAARGAHVIDADAVGHGVLRGPARQVVIDAFGADVAGPDGNIDRKRLAAQVFADPAARLRLEAITHPLIFREIRRLLAEAPPSTSVAVVEAPVLVEALRAHPGALELDALVVVAASPEVRLERAVARGMDAAEARRRIGAQLGEAARAGDATHVIDNDADLGSLERRVSETWEALQAGA